MPASSLLALIDDIASILDDVSVMTKVAAKKTAAVLGDDLALNAQQVSGVKADRELPVVWAVAKGSMINKLILVPSALAISWAAPWAVMPLLMIGGVYLCFEGCEKLAHRLLHSKHEDQAHHQQLVSAIANPAVDMVAVERGKIKGAIRTDFILSAEIIVITLGTVATEPFLNRVLVLTGIAAIMTVGVYGLVAGIVKLDDGGLYLSARAGAAWSARATRALGRAILVSAPFMLKGISVLGTAAMFLVGGGIMLHGIPPADDWLHDVTHAAGEVAAVGGVLQLVVPMVINGVAGVIAGAVVLACVLGAKRVFRRSNPSPAT
jgi:predicted DNA repair protein MutK